MANKKDKDKMDALNDLLKPITRDTQVAVSLMMEQGAQALERFSKWVSELDGEEIQNITNSGSSKMAVSMMIEAFLEDNPSSIAIHSQVSTLTMSAFLLGYFNGIISTGYTIPAAFKEIIDNINNLPT